MHLFAYGTLMSPEIMHEVSGLSPAGIAARLNDFRRHRVKNESWPALSRHVELQVTGVLYLNISPEAWRRLDHFEGAMYQRIQVDVTTESGSYKAYAYTIHPDYHDQLEDTDWLPNDFTEKDKDKFRRSYRGYRNLIKS